MSITNEDDGSSQRFTKIRKELKDKGERILSEIRKMFNTKNGQFETRLIKNERPEDYIERIVIEEKFDLVALGFRSEHSKSKKITKGKVAQKIFDDSPCRVLIAR